MANTVRDYTLQRPAAGVLVVQWAGLDGDDTGKPIRLPYYSDKSIQIGAYGGNTHGGGTFILQGSNDPVADPDHPDHGTAGANAVWFTLADPQGNAISRTTTEKIEQVLENPLWIRPSSSGGTGSDMDFIMVCKGT